MLGEWVSEAGTTNMANDPNSSGFEIRAAESLRRPIEPVRRGLYGIPLDVSVETFLAASGTIGLSGTCSGGMPSGTIFGFPPGAPGAFTGYANFPRSWTITCVKCGKFLSNGITGDSVCVTGVSGLRADYCWRCAGYGYQTHEFRTPAEWIRLAVPFAPDTPAEIIADWLAEHGSEEAERIMRMSRS